MILLALVFVVMKTWKNIRSICQKILSKGIFIDFLLIEKEVKEHYVFVKDFNTIMHHGKKLFVLIVYRLLVQQKCSKVINDYLN